MPVNDSGGIQAFVAETVVDATGVAVVLSEEDEEDMEKKRYMKRGLIAAAAIALLVVVISVPVAITQVNKNQIEIQVVKPADPTPRPTPLPTASPTFSPTVALFPRIVQTLSPISGQFLLQVGTPANRALDWIANRDGLQRDPSDPRFVQRFVAAVFYYATNGDGWRDCREGKAVCRDPKSDSYLSATDECLWFGNDCKEGMIFKIYQGTSIGNGLVGSIPSELAHLPALESLFLQNNRLRGTIPTELGRLTNFHTLVVTNNLLEGPFPDQILDNRLMGTIFIERNQFKGPIPTKFAEQANLQLLLAFENEFTGKVDPRFGSLTKLEALELGSNQLTGTIPPAIASSTSLENVAVDRNKLGGGIPEAIFGMPKLKQLNLTGNEFIGTIPRTIGNLGSELTTRQKKFVNLAGNRFSGSIPPVVGNILDLKELTLHGNAFVGNMPATICALETSAASQSFKLTRLTSDCAEVDCSCSDACECY
eukprot:CAMPEP_0113547448 /NCGR_PEP_ID=MMETSP0015_2-20120614/12361_1 /TAXON_ID=2838 /ORGANISM="Odontella" /LENGTH=480 /DNA_ID=CAMNT_0000448003 /DNA_START=1 /DNA_END=1443 /DNA_ORIENTATION=+ /assembly_acc=CAM_ASM_000160